jgi:hypothetical protein
MRRMLDGKNNANAAGYRRNTEVVKMQFLIRFWILAVSLGIILLLIGELV